PLIFAMTVPSINENNDQVVWKSSLDITKPFSVGIVWNDIRHHGNIMAWTYVVWFGHCQNFLRLACQSYSCRLEALVGGSWTHGIPKSHLAPSLDRLIVTRLRKTYEHTGETLWNKRLGSSLDSSHSRWCSFGSGELPELFLVGWTMEDKPSGGSGYCTIKGKDGSLQISYVVLKYAVYADLEIEFQSTSEEPKLTGIITAYYGEDFDHDRPPVQFYYATLWNIGDPAFVKPGKLNLMRSVLAVPAKSSLIIEADIYEKKRNFVGRL
ncbi:hypothetical protein Tco_1267682, partial [Tanacetum coccineum]